MADIDFSADVEELTPFPKTKNTAQKNVGGSAPITHDYKS
jgi:hypothetical protein